MPAKPKPDINEIYTLMDRAGLDTPNIMTTRKPMSQIVNGIRTSLNQLIVEYIEAREKGGSDEHKIEVQEITSD